MTPSQRTRSAAITVAATIGVAVGGFAIASAVTQQVAHPPVDDATMAVMPHDGPPPPTVFPEIASTGGFSNQTTAIDAGVELANGSTTVTARRSGTDVCYVATYVDHQSSGCFNDETLRSGFAVTASGGPMPNGPLDVIGIVPDEVTHVVIGGQRIDVEQNIWQYSASPEADLAYEVFSAEKSVRLGS